MPKMLLTLAEVDYDLIQRAIAVRQRWRCMPDADESCVAGATLAEICRGWLEAIEQRERDGEQ